MNSLQMSEEAKTREEQGKIGAISPENTWATQDLTMTKSHSVSLVPEIEDESLNNGKLVLPENRFKLKPEQSYKKETKASRLGKSTGRWTQKEHILFIEGLKIYGKNWKKVESYIGTRTGTQIRSHAQKFFNRIRKEFSTEDPSKYVIDNMGDESIRRIVLEHWGDDVSISNDEKDFSSDTPEVLFSITKEKTNKRKRDEVDFTPKSIGVSGSAFKSFKREDTELSQKSEDSKSKSASKSLVEPSSKFVMKSQPQTVTPKAVQPMDIDNLLLQAMMTANSPSYMNMMNSFNANYALTYLLTMLNGSVNLQ